MFPKSGASAPVPTDPLFPRKYFWSRAISGEPVREKIGFNPIPKKHVQGVNIRFYPKTKDPIHTQAKLCINHLALPKMNFII